MTDIYLWRYIIMKMTDIYLWRYIIMKMTDIYLWRYIIMKMTDIYLWRYIIMKKRYFKHFSFQLLVYGACQTTILQCIHDNVAVGFLVWLHKQLGSCVPEGLLFNIYELMHAKVDTHTHTQFFLCIYLPWGLTELHKMRPNWKPATHPPAC